jgi:hypothetical protein
MLKSNTAALDVPLFETVAEDPSEPVETVPTDIVAAVPVAPVAPVAPRRSLVENPSPSSDVNVTIPVDEL